MTDRVNNIIRTAAVLVAAFSFVLGLAARAEAADVEWAPGFPKLSDDKVLLMWNTVEGADGYKVYRRRGESGDFMLLTTGKVNRYIDSKTEGGHNYFYNVVAVKGDKDLGKSEDKMIVREATQKFVAMTAPKLVGVLEKPELEGRASVGVRWEMDERPTDLAAYNIYRSTKKGGPYTLVGSSQSDLFTDSDIERGKTYYYAVSAVDNNFEETKRSTEMSVNVTALEIVVPKTKQPTKMMRAKHLFDIGTYPDSFKRDKEGKPVQVPIGFPVDVAVDEAVGHIYVAANEYGGVLVYNMEGKFQFGIRADGVNSKRKLRGIHSVAVGPGGKVYATTYASPSIYVFDFSGKLDSIIEVDIEKITGMKPWRGIPQHYDVSVNSEGDLYAVDKAYNRVHVFDNRGRHKYEIEGGDGKLEGFKKYLFNGPGFGDCTPDGRFLLVDTSYGNLMEFDSEGNFQKIVAEGGGSMGLAEKLYMPTGVSVDAKGRVFVANGTDPNVQAFDMKGNFLFAISNDELNGPIKSNNIRGIDVDNSGRLYLTEVLSNTVAVYQLGGEVEKIVTGGAKKE